MKIPFDREIAELGDLPYTLSFVIRKRMQMDSLNELPEEKRPPDAIVWWGKPEEVNKWIKDVFSNKKQPVANLVIKDSEIED